MRDKTATLQPHKCKCHLLYVFFLLLSISFPLCDCQLSSPSVSVEGAASLSTSSTSSALTWVGEYTPKTGQCVSSSSCCCSNGQPMRVTADAVDPSAVVLSGVSDGGAGCFFQSTLGGTLVLTSSNTAHVSYPTIGLNVSATLSEDNNQLTIISSRTTCAVEFIRSSSTAALPISSTASQQPVVPATWATTGFPTDSSSITGGSPASTNPAHSSSSSGVVEYESQILVMPPTGPSPSSSSGQHQFVVAFSVPSVTPVADVYLHYAATSDPVTQSVSMPLQSDIPLTFSISSQTPRLVFLYEPVILADIDLLSYGFSFTCHSQVQYTPTYTFSYNASLSREGASSSSSSSGVSSSSSGSGMDVSPHPCSLFIGRYETTSLCVPSGSCCCGAGFINISQSSLSPDQLLVSMSLDGSTEGCRGQTQLNVAFTVNSRSPFTLTKTFFSSQGSSVTFYIMLSTADPHTLQPSITQPLSSLTTTQYLLMAAEYSLLSISNSFCNCITTALRTSAADPNPRGAADAGSASSTGETTAGVSPIQQNFIGSYLFDTSCLKSATCCCAIGEMEVRQPSQTDFTTALAALPPSSAPTPTTATLLNVTNSLLLSGTLDGGTACAGQTHVSQVFSIASPSTAEFSFDSFNLIATLTNDGQHLGPGAGVGNDGNDALVFLNSVYPACISRAHRSSLYVTPTSPVLPLPALVDMSSVVGNYRSDGSCVPSLQCCCTDGVTTITPSNSSMNQLSVSTVLDGDMLSCFNMDGPLTLQFTAVNTSYATCFYQQILFTANLQSDQSVLIVNSLHPRCPTTLRRTPAKSGSERKRLTGTWLTTICMTLLWLYCWSLCY